MMRESWAFVQPKKIRKMYKGEIMHSILEDRMQLADLIAGWMHRDLGQCLPLGAVSWNEK